ncbi:Zinc finger protein 511 [Habropoda laboriosa]|uniref:Zinc finger protein 511 n=1 Tax=Habropoda laboriosa TaxID=597456 RepID=A0A0L7QT34_9HYME|nr:Zinc finger protein 511 [Habropoda laboriosa]
MEEFLQNLGVGLRSIDDPFFDDSYNTCKIFKRKGVTVEDDEELCHEIIKEFPCHVTGCRATFKTLIDFEMHYNSNHRYVCGECKKSLPNPRLLDIHIQETHDSFFQVLCMKQPMYQCYVSECDLKFNNASERRKHCATQSTVSVNSNVHESPSNVVNTSSGSSSLAFIPRQIQKSYTKALTKNETNEKDVLQTGCMMDLANSLPD